MMKNMTKIKHEQLRLMIKSITELSKLGINSTTEKIIVNFLNLHLPFFFSTYHLLQFPKLERITINKNVVRENRRITEISHLKYPPEHLVKKNGRCNLVNQSVLYASTQKMTAFSEMRPKVGDLITKSIWKLKTDNYLKISPIVHIQPTNGTVNPRTLEFENEFYKLINKEFKGIERDAIIELSQFVSDSFTKIVTDNHLDYLVSAYFSDKILNGKDGVDGIIYPSLKAEFSFENIALKASSFDNNYQLAEVHESIVFKDPYDGDGGLMMYGLSECDDFSDNKINWSNIINQPKGRIEFLKKEYKLKFE